MQDIHSIGGGGGRFFGGGGGVDRRLRPNSLHQNSNQSLKCPRCDSLNTKFCYYNNYNLSQPRHFCKSCRRYWTKGGVLRNVPVGGGCRKTNRSSKKHKKTSDQKKSNNNSRSSSENSSLTASTTVAAGNKPPPAAVASPSASTPATLLNNFPDSRFFSFPVDHSTDGGVFTEIGSFTSMMTSTNDHSFLGFNVGDISGTGYHRLHQNDGVPAVRDERPEHHQWDHHHQQQKMEELSAGFLDRTAQIDLSGMESRGNNCGVGTLDWQGGGDQAMFDLTGTVDHAYWNQTQWPDNDHSLYLP